MIYLLVLNRKKLSQPNIHGRLRMRPTVNNYKQDKYYPKVVRAVAAITENSNIVAPVEVMIKMGNLRRKDFNDWKRGRVPYLEKVFLGNLSKANRILRILRFHAHDLNMIPSFTAYRQIGCKRPLRFSKTEDKSIEKAYSRHFKLNLSKKKPKIDGQASSTSLTANQTVQPHPCLPRRRDGMIKR